jgi:hypothetical protein
MKKLGLLLLFYGLLLLIPFTIGQILELLYPPSPEQQEAMARDRARQRTIAEEAAKLRPGRCHYRFVCRKYASARQDCAAAGNFTLCVDVKMGDRDAASISMCDNDGGVRYASDDWPNRFQCLFENPNEAMR